MLAAYELKNPYGLVASSGIEQAEMRVNPGFRVAIDVGGTFIDLVALNEDTGSIKVDSVTPLKGRTHQAMMVLTVCAPTGFKAAMIVSRRFSEPTGPYR